MLVCSCNLIDHNAIEAEVDRQLADDPARVLSPVRVYCGLGERPRCGGCLPLAEKIITSRKQSAAGKVATMCRADASVPSHLASIDSGMRQGA